MSLKLCLVSFVLAACCAGSARAAEAVLPPDASVDAVLDALDQKGKTLEDLTADVSLSRIDPNLGSSKTRTGHVWLRKASPDDFQLHVVFDKVQEGRLSRDEKHEYLFENGWLTDRDYRIRAEVRREVLKPGQKMNVMKLGEGPFPLPIGQDKQDVRRAFDVKKEKPAADDPPDTIHLVLTPKPDTRLARKFSQIDVFVDRKSHFPVRVDTTDPQQTETQQTVLTNIRVNAPGGLSDAEFKVPAIDQNNWSTRTEAYAD